MKNIETSINQKKLINNLKQENLKLTQQIKIILKSLNKENKRLKISINNTNNQISELQEEIKRIHSSRFFKLWQKIRRII